MIRGRTSEGPKRAKARGVKLGRKPKLTEHQKREAICRRDRHGEPVREIAAAIMSATARFRGSQTSLLTGGVSVIQNKPTVFISHIQRDEATANAIDAEIRKARR
jgi:hypothetical protein